MPSLTVKSICFGTLFALTSAQDGVPYLNFDCATMPDVCTNMCWGAFCTVPAFQVKLTYDSYAGQGAGGEVDMSRRRNAGCQPNPNRCSTRPGENCDEYPFASTLDADDGGQVTRCVPMGQNSRQGGIISGFTNTCGVTCEFIITFGNPGAANVAYCMAAGDLAGRCLNDRDPPIYKRFDDGTLAPDVDYANAPLAARSLEQRPAWGLFLLSSGMEAIMPMSAMINSTVLQPKARNQTLLSLVEAGQEDWNALDWDFKNDYVIARLD